MADGDGSLAQQLDAAYLEFKAFLQRRKAYCSQPPFRPGLATRHCFVAVLKPCVHEYGRGRSLITRISWINRSMD